jgi:hypothetical protein
MVTFDYVTVSMLFLMVGQTSAGSMFLCGVADCYWFKIQFYGDVEPPGSDFTWFLLI